MIKKTKYAIIDIEGYTISNEMKQEIFKNKELEKYNYLTKGFDTDPNLDTSIKRDFFSIGIQIVEIETDDTNSTAKMNYGAEYSLLRVDRVLYDKYLAKGLFVFRRRSLVARMNLSDLCKNHDELKKKLNDILIKENVVGIMAAGDSEKKFLTGKVKFKEYENTDSYFTFENNSLTGSNGTYYYVDLQKINQIMIMADDIKDGKLIANLKKNKSFSSSLNQYSVKAESIFKAVLSTLDSDKSLNRDVKVQLHDGLEDAKMEGTILDALIQYEATKKGSKLLYNIFKNNVKTAQTIEVILNAQNKIGKTLKRTTAKQLNNVFPDNQLNLSNDYINALIKLISNNWNKTKIESSDVLDSEFLDNDQFYESLQKQEFRQKIHLKDKNFIISILKDKKNQVGLYKNIPKKTIYIGVNNIQIIGKIKYFEYEEKTMNSILSIYNNLTKPENIILNDKEKIINEFYVNQKVIDKIAKNILEEFKIGKKGKESLLKLVKDNNPNDDTQEKIEFKMIEKYVVNLEKAKNKKDDIARFKKTMQKILLYYVVKDKNMIESVKIKLPIKVKSKGNLSSSPVGTILQISIDQLLEKYIFNGKTKKEIVKTYFLFKKSNVWTQHLKDILFSVNKSKEKSLIYDDTKMLGISFYI